MRRSIPLLVLSLCVPAAAQQWHAIDTAASNLTVRASKSGLFSGFAHDHEIRARIADGRVSLAPEAVELRIETAQLEVLDPDLSADKRAEVQKKMLSEDVLGAARFPEIAFRSTGARKAGDNAWDITGELTLHGTTHPVVVRVVQDGRAFHGSARVSQREFGIRPVSVAGGTVKVKDEVAIEFEVRIAQ